MSDKPILVLFDVDGTLTPSRKTINDDMLNTLTTLKNKCTIGFVGGSNLEKQQEQLGEKGMSLFDYSFPENGLSAYKGTNLISETSFINHVGEEVYKELVNFCLHYIADLKIPVKRGTFIEFRKGLVNVCPIGRSCTQKERDEFEKFDNLHQIRIKMVEALQKRFKGYNLMFSIGGQISIDVFPVGWDKTFCLQHITDRDFEEIHFFGDKTEKGGNDYEIYNDKRVVGHKTTSPEVTIQLLHDLGLI